MKECKICKELVLMIRYAINENNIEEAKRYTKELLDLLNGYDSAC